MIHRIELIVDRDDTDDRWTAQIPGTPPEFRFTPTTLFDLEWVVRLVLIALECIDKTDDVTLSFRRPNGTRLAVDYDDGRIIEHVPADSVQQDWRLLVRGGVRTVRRRQQNPDTGEITLWLSGLGAPLTIPAEKSGYTLARVWES